MIERLAELHPAIPISIDTRKASVAVEALAAGAAIVNDVSGGADPDMFDVVRERDAAVVLMHMRGVPKTMQEAPRYDDVVGEVHEYLRQRIEAAELAGIDPERIAIDPGIGFGKDLEHNLELMRRVDVLLDLRRPVLVGPSRKRFLGTILDVPEDDRIEGTIGAVVWLVSRGAHLVRVHDVKEVVRAVRVANAIAGAAGSIATEKRRVRVPSGELAVVEAGDPEAPPVVLLSGGFTSSYLWRHLVPLLAPWMRVLAPDLLGSGD